LQRHFRVSPPVVHEKILALERKGLLERVPWQARSIRVLVAPEDLPSLREPSSGPAADGEAEDLDQAEEASAPGRMIDYDRMAAEYARHRRVHPVVLRRLIGGLGPTASVLEVGCGTGNYLVAIRELVGCSCWGVEPSAEMLARARARSEQVQLLQGRAEALEMPAGPFDLVFSVDVIHHVGDRGRLFGEAWRVLRPGGRSCTVTDSEWVIRHRQPLAVYFPGTVEVDLGRYPSIEALRGDMERAGFAEVEEEMVEFAYELGDIGPFRDKAFSCLQLIPEEAFRRGIERMEKDLLTGPIAGMSRYTLVWGVKPLSFNHRGT
jgi:SAM-dependent methyltransferase